jgi:predicted kinase
MFAVVVSGLPGSGKTTLAVPLAERLGLPLLSKDQIKEVLSSTLAGDSRQLGRAAVHVLLALAARAPEVVLESFFWPGLSEPELLALDRPLVQVHCSCPPDVARDRFLRRAEAGERHPVHHPMDDWERFAERGALLDLPGPCLRVDTSGQVPDVAVLTEQVRAALGGQPPDRR